MQRRINILQSLDWTTVILYLILVLLGWINIYAAVYNEEHHSIFDISQRYGKQLIWIVFAFILAWIVLMIDFNFYSYFAYFIYGATILTLILVLLIGTKVHGARSWFSFAGFALQPSEFAKFATALAIAKYTSNYNFNLMRFKTFSTIIIILFLPAVLIVIQPDTGSGLVYASFILVLFREGLPKWILGVGLLLPILFILSLVFEPYKVILMMIFMAFGFYGINYPNIKNIFFGAIILLVTLGFCLTLWAFNILPFSFGRIILLATVLSSLIFLVIAIIKKIKGVLVSLVFLAGILLFTQTIDYFFHSILKPHQQQRINIMLGIDSDPLGIGYNLNQSKIAIGSGGFAGKGFLQGTQTKFNFVPEQTTDFIFCTVGEEWGFIGSFLVIFLFTFLLLRLIFLAERQRSLFARIYAYGVLSVLFFHFFINIGMTIGVIPVIGIPLPFFSYGGSSLWAFTILLFIFLNFDARRLEVLR
jgi:rod shape determining protein RodA